MKLRNYQVEASDIAIKFFEESSMKKALQVLATGAGKSLCIGEIANRLKDKVLCIQSSKELLEQNYNKFISYGQEASIYSASFGKKEHGNVTFATIGSIVKKGEEFRKQGYKYILLDEAHTFKAGNGMWGNFLKTSKIQKVLGLTATPFKMETLGGQFDSYSRLKMITNRGLHYPMFEDIIYLQQIQEIIKLGFWSKIEYEVFDIDTGDLVFNSTGADFTEESINKFYKTQGLEKKIINRIMDSEGQAILVFVPSIQDAQSLAAKVPNSACVYSGMPSKERDRIIDEYRSGKIRTVFNVNILSIGFDYPEIDHIIDAKPKGNLGKIYQALGRCVRIHPNKEKAIVTDFSGNINRYGQIEDIFFKKSMNKWQVYGSDNRLLSDIAIKYIRPWKHEGEWNVYINFGKYFGKRVSDLPDNVLIDMFKNTNWDSSNMHIREDILEIKKQRVK